MNFKIGDQVKHKDQFGIILQKDEVVTDVYEIYLPKTEKSLWVKQEELTLLTPFYRGQLVEVRDPYEKGWLAAEYIAYDHISKGHLVFREVANAVLRVTECRPHKEPKSNFEEAFEEAIELIQKETNK